MLPEFWCHPSDISSTEIQLKSISQWMPNKIGQKIFTLRITDLSNMQPKQLYQFLKIAAAVVTDEKSWIRNRMVRFTVRTSTSANDEQVERPPVYGAICIKLTLAGNHLLYRHLDMMV